MKQSASARLHDARLAPLSADSRVSTASSGGGGGGGGGGGMRGGSGGSNDGGSGRRGGDSTSGRYIGGKGSLLRYSSFQSSASASSSRKAAKALVQWIPVRGHENYTLMVQLRDEFECHRTSQVYDDIGTAPADLRSWLTTMGLVKCYTRFKDAGYDDLELIAHLDEADLDAIQVTHALERATLLQGARHLLRPGSWPEGVARHNLFPSVAVDAFSAAVAAAVAIAAGGGGGGGGGGGCTGSAESVSAVAARPVV